MATKVHMEALSPTMEEGRLVKWLKKEGEPVKTGDTLAEVETDKAVMELVARADGQLIKVLVQEGATVPVGNVVAYIGTQGEKVDGGAPETPAPAPGPARKKPPVAEPPPEPEPQSEPEPEPQPAEVKPQAAPAASRAAPPPTAPGPKPSRPEPAVAAGGRIKASPLALRVAAERGVDLKLVQGSGPGGRVILRDVETARGSERGSAAPQREPTPAPRAPIVSSGSPYEDVPLTQIRKTIAKRLAASIGPIPHFFLTTDVDMERAAEAREAINQQLGDQGKISYNDIILKATALALLKHRACNAWWQDDHIRYWNEVHLGMAVAVEDGLITPVIRYADQKSLLMIGTEARELAQRARNRRLKPEEYTGATFSVSNLGMFDIEHFTAVINPPEAGIIAVGSIVPRPVGDSEGKIAVRRGARLTMSCDHRVIDGATGAAFLQTLKGMLENPLAMVL